MKVTRSAASPQPIVHSNRTVNGVSLGVGAAHGARFAGNRLTAAGAVPAGSQGSFTQEGDRKGLEASKGGARLLGFVYC